MGVRNLAAMFEQKGEDSPPERGRSPAVSALRSPTPSDSPRPLSKIRTSFVAIEKDGRIGLQHRRELSGDSVTSSIKSGSDENAAPASISEKIVTPTSAMAPSGLGFKTNLAKLPIPEPPPPPPLPHLASPARIIPSSGSRTPEVVPNANPDKVTDEEETKTKLTPGDPKKAAGSNGTTPKDTSPDRTNGGTAVKAVAKPVVKPAAATSKPSPKPSPKKTSVPTTTKPLAAKPLKPAAASRPSKSPVRSPARLPVRSTHPPADKKSGTPAAKDTAPKTEARKTEAHKAEPRKSEVHKPAVHKTETHKPAAPRSTASSVKKPAKVEHSPPPNTGFVKPRPKSPTRPVKLPASLTTHTASSASKAGTSSPPRQSLSRASANRPGSRVSMSGASAQGLKRQSSTVNRARPSLGPPPKPVAKDHPVVKKEAKDVDNSFLARMMRPTQASASKTSGKTQTTPPRAHAAPTTVKKTSAKDHDGSGKKAATKIASSVKPKEHPPTAKRSSSQLRSSSQRRSSSQKRSASPKHEQPTAKDVAPAVAQTSSAEQAIAAASVSKDTATTPVVEQTEKQVEAAVSEVEEELPAEEPLEVVPESKEESEEVPQEVAQEQPKEEPEVEAKEATNEEAVQDTTVEQPKEETTQEKAELSAPKVEAQEANEVQGVDSVAESQPSSEEPKAQE